ncbi:methyl-accepting chemotaxis protein [Azospirillaceae bacterium]
MAKAYVENGTEFGNRIMKKFDAQANRFIEISRKMKESLLKYRNSTTSEMKNYIDEQLQVNVTDLYKLSAIGIVFVILFIIAFLVIFKVTTALGYLSTVMLKLASGQDNVEIPFQSSKDELGVVARSVSTIKSSLEAVAEIQNSQKAAFDRIEMNAQQETQSLAANFEQSVQELVRTVASKANEVQTMADSVGAAALTAQNRSKQTTDEADRAGNNITHVVELSTNLNVSIATINQLAEESVGIASQAEGEAERSRSIVASLSEAVEQIEDIITIINQIASQTNLLALNATIEAARAGDAGKGFAVVAHEVKNLAIQTGNATRQVADRIDAIRNQTGNVTGAIEAITNSVGLINQSIAKIGSAVGKQQAATFEIDHYVSEAKDAMVGVITNIRDVEHQIANTGNVASLVSAASNEMVGNLNQLRSGADRFLRHVRRS